MQLVVSASYHRDLDLGENGQEREGESLRVDDGDGEHRDRVTIRVRHRIRLVDRCGSSETPIYIFRIPIRLIDSFSLTRCF